MKKAFKLIVLTFFVACLTTFYGSVSDIDGNIYKPIQIGTQLWMAENLKTTKFNDGALIPNVTDNIKWQNLTTPGYSWYNNDAASYKTTYGALHNWHAVNTDILCPVGWHVPAEGEFNSLIGNLGNAGGKMTEPGNSLWLNWLNFTTGVINESGFTALPGGERHFYEDFVYPEVKFGNIGYYGMWWLATGEGSSGSTFALWWDDEWSGGDITPEFDSSFL